MEIQTSIKKWEFRPLHNYVICVTKNEVFSNLCKKKNGNLLRPNVEVDDSYCFLRSHNSSFGKVYCI